MLKSHFYELELRKRQAEADKLEAGKTDVGWSRQILSYVLDNSRIKAQRTNVEISATQKVLDGDLDVFIEFGSHAWGTPGPDSDLDLLVIVADSDLPPHKRA